jgi:hypothetical protein
VLNEINKGSASKYPLLAPNGKPKDRLASGPEKARGSCRPGHILLLDGTARHATWCCIRPGCVTL